MNFKFLLAVFVVAVALMPTAHSNRGRNKERLKERLKKQKTKNTDCDELTRDDNEYMKYYNWSHSEQSGRLTFEARGSDFVHVLFSFCDGCDGYEIIIGGWGNQWSVIREYKGQPYTDPGTDKHSTPNILSPTEMRTFWIDIKKEGNGVRIEAGEGTEATGFMSRSWGSNRYNSWPPTYVAFAAWDQEIDYKFCLKNQPGKIVNLKPSCQPETFQGAFTEITLTKYRYDFFPWSSSSSQLIVDVKGDRDANIKFSSCDGCDGYRVLIGGWANQKSFIRDNEDDGNLQTLVDSPDILSTTDYRRFIINFKITPTEFKIEVSKDGECFSFLERSWEAGSKPWPMPSYIAFSGYTDNPMHFRFPALDCSSILSSGGWKRVRHVPQGTTWHPVNDNLLGTGSYGNQNDDTNAWSIPWSIEEFDEFLFSSGDKKYWLVVSKEELIGADGGKLYADSPITVIASSSSCEPYQAKMYKRVTNGEDPWVSIENHWPIADNQMVYGENSLNHHNQILRAHGGMDVFIRKIKGNN